jgi:Cof subfamily protein (haloacid dehalogenase superfamily)
MSTTPRIRALFLDIDGTIVDRRERIPEPVKNAISQARDLGCEVVLSTGRTRFTAMPIVEQIDPLPDYLIAANGAVAMHLPTRDAIVRRLMPLPLAQKMIRMLLDAGADPYVFEDAVGEGVEAARVLYHPERTPGHWATFPRYRPHAGLPDNLPFLPVSVSAFGATSFLKPLVERMRQELPDEVCVIESGSNDGSWNAEFYVKGVSKQTALEVVATHLGVSRAEIMAVGDHRNDIEMIQWAGLGVAMGNALPEVKEIADHITGTWAENGVAQAIERFVLTPS